MKNWLTQALGLCAVAALALTGCKKDDVQATLAPSNSPTLTASTNSVVLLQANSKQTAVTFTWTPISSFTWTNVDHPYTPTVAYTFQVDKKGNNFAAPLSIAAGTGPTTALNVRDLNILLTTFGLTSGTATDLEVRLNTNYAPNAQLYSAVVPLTVTTYTEVCLPPTGSSSWSIIGPAGVDWNTDIPMKYNCDTNTFDLTRMLNAGDFKFRANDDWGVNYGSATSTGGALVSNGPNITVATPGTYTIKLDLNNQVFSIH